MNVNPPAAANATIGLGHFFAQGDALAKALLAIVFAMSVLSWLIIAIKGAALLVNRSRSSAFLALFWNATSLDAVSDGIGAQGPRDPFSHLAVQAMQAQQHHAKHAGSRLAEAGTSNEFVTRTIRKVLDEEAIRLDNGLSVLATIGATAPFVGLFGTVWGVYQALLAVGMSGAGTLDQVAGPVGEALIMTALGLAVAIPAVVGYNALARANRVLIARLDAFAHELHTFVSMGRPLGARALLAGRTSEVPPERRARMA